MGAALYARVSTEEQAGAHRDTALAQLLWSYVPKRQGASFERAVAASSR